MSETEKKSNTIGLKSRGSTASWKLRAIQPDGTASEVFLVDGMTIGRTNANSLQARDDGSGVVERSHARVDFQDDGSVVLKCLHESAGVETSGNTVSSLRLDIGSTFRIGETHFEVVANPTSEQVSIASAGRGCPYCGHPDLPTDRGVATRCAECGKSIVVVPAEQNLGVPTFLPGIFHDAEGKEYLVERFVARGGMGYVLKGTAEHDTVVAIKVLLFDSNTNSQAVSRFKQEIDLLRKLHDPNVLRLISHGQEAGLFFFVMEWVDGHDLRSQLPSPGKPETHVDFAKALRWFEQACEGLSAIHRAGAVHRDIKPSNLLLRNDGHLLIADLGVAKRLNDGETGMTCTGQLPGTYWYMAPEQHYAPDLVDQRTDIYSLGLTFWELLTGFRFSGVDPQPPSKANPTVPKDFDDILRTMLATRIDDRPGTMLEVLRSLPKPVIRPASQIANEPAPESSTAVMGPIPTVVVASQELRHTMPTGRVDTGSAPAGPPPDLIARGVARVEAALRKCEALIKASVAYLRPKIVQLIKFVASKAAYLRRVLKSAMPPPSPPASSLPSSGNQSSTAGSTGASAARTALGDSSAVAANYDRSPASDSLSTSATASESDVAATGQVWEGGREKSSDRVSTTPIVDEAAMEQAAAREAESARAREEIEAKLQEALDLPEGSNERLDALKRARRALTLAPAVVRTTAFENELRPAIEGHLREALRTRGDDAFSVKRYGTALLHYQDLCQLSLADELVSDRIDHILALRKSAVTSAVTRLQRGHLSQAREQLVQLQADFQGDAGFIPECEQLLTKTRLIEQRVKETIPALRATKSLFRMSKMLEELASDKIAISGLDSLLEKTRKTLSEGTQRLEMARSLLEEGRVEAARKAVADVRRVISDHPDADELSGRADAEEARQNKLVQQIHALTEQGKLFGVYQALRGEDPKRVAKLGLINELNNAVAYKRRSDRFLRLVLWAVGGSGCVCVASYVSHRIWENLTPAITDSGIRGVLENSTSGRCLYFALFSLSAYVGLYGLRELLGRKHKSRLIFPDVVVLLVTVIVACGIDIGLNVLSKQLFAQENLAAFGFVSKWGYWCRVGGTAAVLASTIATFARIGTDIVRPTAAVRLGPAMLFGFAFALASAVAPLGLLENPTFGSYEIRSLILGTLPSAMLAVAAISVLCRVSVQGVYGWTITSVAVGISLLHQLGIHDFVSWSWCIPIWMGTLTCGLFLVMSHHTYWNIGLAVGTACAAVGATTYLLTLEASQQVFAQLLPWAAACTIVPLIAQQSINRDFNLSDRVFAIIGSLQSPHEDASRFLGGEDERDNEDIGAKEEQENRVLLPKALLLLLPAILLIAAAPIVRLAQQVSSQGDVGDDVVTAEALGLSLPSFDSEDRNVFVLGVDKKFPEVRSAIEDAKKGSGRGYRVIVVGNAGGSPNAATELLDSLRKSLQQISGEGQAQDGMRVADPTRDVLILLATKNRQIAMRVPFALETSAGLEPAVIRDLIEREYVPSAVEGLYDQGLAKLVNATESSIKAALAEVSGLPIPAAEPHAELLTNSIGMRLMLIKPGTCDMGQIGGEANGTQRVVRLTKPFYLGIYEVTNAQWRRVMKNYANSNSKDNHPVHQVTWEEAVEFCERLSSLNEESQEGRVYRLPTEAEWEYACRAGTTTRFPFGHDEQQLDAYAWYGKNAGKRTHPVGEKKPNSWGLYDMSGNVWEWCSDYYEVFQPVSGPVNDPIGPPEGSDRVCRGGGWSDEAARCGSGYRGSLSPSIPLNDLGFRVALTAK